MNKNAHHQKNVHEQWEAEAEPKKIKNVLFTRETFSGPFRSSACNVLH